ncbi:unnamed protein product [Closterium sp. Naga37s-1]|nr:unnamed protein product [Closterium sp. Naga37s-1]
MGPLYNHITSQQPPLEEWRSFVHCTHMVGRELGQQDHFKGQEGNQKGKGERGGESGACVCALDAHGGARAGTASPFQRAGRPVAHQPSLCGAFLAEQAAAAAAADAASFSQYPCAASSTGFQTIPFIRSASEKPIRIDCSYLIGCDGANSSIRAASFVPVQLSQRPDETGNAANHNWGKGEDEPLITGQGVKGELQRVTMQGHRQLQRVTMQGHRQLQRVLSVHFSSRPLGLRLLALPRPAMLYFVYNKEGVGVVVAHCLREGEFVAQCLLLSNPPPPTRWPFLIDYLDSPAAPHAPRFLSSRTARMCQQIRPPHPIPSHPGLCPLPTSFTSSPSRTECERMVRALVGDSTIPITICFAKPCVTVVQVASFPFPLPPLTLIVRNECERMVRALVGDSTIPITIRFAKPCVTDRDHLVRALINSHVYEEVF